MIAEATITQEDNGLLVVEHGTSLADWEAQRNPVAGPEVRAEENHQLHEDICQKLVAIGWEPDAVDELLRHPGFAEELALRNYNNHGNTHALGSIIDEALAKHFRGSGLSNDPPKVCGRGEAFVVGSALEAEELSVPRNGFEYISESGTVQAYRGGTLEDPQGVGYQPVKDVRTTEGSFHITGGVGDPVPDDKRQVPREVAGRLIKAAHNPPDNLKTLPYTVDSGDTMQTMVTMTYKVYVEPEEVGENRKFALIQFEAPGEWVGNLNFVGDIFPYGGDPFDSENNPKLDPNWCGHVGCIVLAPHLQEMTARDAGLPNKLVLEDGDRRLKDGMYFEAPDELYNDGKPFVLHTRDADVTHVVITDNYYGYCKKMVKTILDHATKRLGDSMEEHSGTIQYRKVTNIGRQYTQDSHPIGIRPEEPFSKVTELLKGKAGEQKVVFWSESADESVHFAVDQELPVVYLPNNIRVEKDSQTITIIGEKETRQLYLDPKLTYMLPNGDQIRLHKDTLLDEYKLILIDADSVIVHKPFTVSGGGKSELAKMLQDLMRKGYLTIDDFKDDLEFVKRIVENRGDVDIRDRFLPGKGPAEGASGRLPLDTNRSLRSLMSLLTPDEERYTPEYNDWLRSIPSHVRYWSYHLKMLWTEEMGGDWPEYFGVDQIGSEEGNRLKFGDPAEEKEYISLRLLRFGFDSNGEPRWFPTAAEFEPGMKFQTGDDISISEVLSVDEIPNLSAQLNNRASVSFTGNSEEKGFQRPDGYEKPGDETLTDRHFGELRRFKCNYEPLDKSTIRCVLRDARAVEKYGESLVNRMRQFADSAENEGKWFFLPDRWRVMREDDGTPKTDPETGAVLLTTNPRYLMPFEDPENSVEQQIARRALHLRRNVPLDQRIYEAVEMVVPANRFDREDIEHNFPPLAVNGPVHAVELPELLAQIAASLTVKSRSTAGPGSEGAATKKPFMELSGIYELNNVLLQLALTEQEVFVTASGRVGPEFAVDHDVSFWAAEMFGIWARTVSSEERTFQYLEESGYIKQEEPFYYDMENQEVCDQSTSNAIFVDPRIFGKRATQRFYRDNMGLVTNDPDSVVPQEARDPKRQDLHAYVRGYVAVRGAMSEVSSGYLADGVSEHALPQVQKLFEILTNGHTSEGWDMQSPEFRNMFTRSYILSMPQYAERLKAKQKQELILLHRCLYEIDMEIDSLGNGGPSSGRLPNRKKVKLLAEKDQVEQRLEVVESDSYLARLRGRIGRDPNLEFSGESHIHRFELMDSIRQREDEVEDLKSRLAGLNEPKG